MPAAVLCVSLLPDHLALLPLECLHRDPAPLRCRPDERREHQLQHLPRAEGVPPDSGPSIHARRPPNRDGSLPPVSTLTGIAEGLAQGSGPFS
jgi:hypothetical protein